MTTKAPWAVLLCKFKSAPPGTVLINPNLDYISVCQKFFTNPNAGFNAVKFFADMSHQKLDLSGSKVFGWYEINASISNYNAAGDPVIDNGKTTQDDVVRMAKQAAKDAGVDISSFTAAVVIMNIATGWAQGGSYSGLPPIGCMAADWRRVDARNPDGTKGANGIGGGNGIEVFGQEMGHGFGLHHSRKNGDPNDYQDNWDIMSTLNAHSAPDNDYGARGPGLNAWNMRSRSWLDESRVWHAPAGGFTQRIQLRPLHAIGLPGMLAAELPPLNITGGFPQYLIEFRKNENWDSGIPRPCVLVHRFEVDGGGPLGGFMNSHSYIMPGTNGNYDLVDGDVFAAGTGQGPFPKLTVIKIDAVNNTADVELSFTPVVPPLKNVRIATNADKRLEAFALANDGSLFHKWQGVPNGGWSQWASLGGHGLLQIEVSRNSDGRLEVFALGGDQSLYHIWQTVPNGTWSSWSGLQGHNLQQISVAKNKDGRLEVFALGGDKAVYHIWQTAPNGGWSSWSGLQGHDLRQITVGANADGRLEIFALGGDGAVYHIWQAVANGAWTPWAGLAGHSLAHIEITANKDGRLELFALGGDKALYHIWQTIPNGAWSAWSGLSGHDLQQICLAQNQDGRLEVFALGSDKAAYHTWQSAPNGNWVAWAGLQGHDLQYLTAAQNADGRVELFAVGGDGTIYHIWQLVPNGGWNNWSSL